MNLEEPTSGRSRYSLVAPEVRKADLVHGLVQKKNLVSSSVKLLDERRLGELSSRLTDSSEEEDLSWSIRRRSG